MFVYCLFSVSVQELQDKVSSLEEAAVVSATILAPLPPPPPPLPGNWIMSGN